MWKHLKAMFFYFLYRQDKSCEHLKFMLAEEKGMYCEGMKNGVAKFDPNRQPQDEPDKPIGYKEFYRKINGKK